MRYMGDATNPFNLPGLPGYDPAKPLGGQVAPPPPGAPTPAPAVTPPLAPNAGAPMDPTVKAAMIANVPKLSAPQQQDLYDIGQATTQASSANMLHYGLGAAAGVAVGYLGATLLRRGRR